MSKIKVRVNVKLLTATTRGFELYECRLVNVGRQVRVFGCNHRVVP